ncbi:hypothetical protein AVDCRST_MAG82-1217, partial [uncultured Rubrobacteraceae bacterium]
DRAAGGRRHHRYSRCHRDTQLHGPTEGGERLRRDGATACRGHVATALLREAGRFRRHGGRARSLWFQAGRATGDGRGRERQYLLHASPGRQRPVRDHPGRRWAGARRML